MMLILKIVLVILLVCLSKVNLMATKNLTLKLYDPCGLDTLHFYKLSDQAWQAKLKLTPFVEERNISVKIFFKDYVTIMDDLSPKGPWNYFEMHLQRPVPQFYSFLVFSNKTNSEEPIITDYAINDKTICNKEIQDKLKKETNNLLEENRLDHPYSCGRRSFDHTEVMSVIGDAETGDWPWHVALFYNAKYKCGGNIISRTAVLTAGHCVYKNGFIYNPYNVIITAGVVNFTNVDYLTHLMRLGLVKEMRAKSIILHPDFLLEKSTSDLAIIKVDPLVFSSYIQPICIFGPTYDDKLALFGRTGIVVGFGLTDKDSLSAIERISVTVIQPDAACMTFSPSVYRELLNEFTFCAGFTPTKNKLQGINPREGDSGAGLILPVPQSDNTVSWFLRGILSKCVKRHAKDAHCDPNYPVIYTDVSPHFSWIHHHRF